MMIAAVFLYLALLGNVFHESDAQGVFHNFDTRGKFFASIVKILNSLYK